ncbi:MAG: hypothetical protein K0U98_11560 [Deltaproteobacteria bacterium]|nr:hypothetical protein [Deltaproteobacteria bacterium]
MGNPQLAADTNLAKRDRLQAHREKMLRTIDGRGLDRLIKISFASAMLDVAVSTYYEWEKVGKAPRIRRRNGVCRVSLKEVQAFMAGNWSPREEK